MSICVEYPAHDLLNTQDENFLHRAAVGSVTDHEAKRVEIEAATAQGDGPTLGVMEGVVKKKKKTNESTVLQTEGNSGP